jgi:hypothetical protein
MTTPDVTEDRPEVTASTRIDAPLVVITGPQAHVCLTVTGHHWHEAYHVIPKRDPGEVFPGVHLYLVRVEHDGRYAVGAAMVDKQMSADLQEAHLPDTLAVSGLVVAVLPEMPDERAAWVMRFMARAVARDLPMYPFFERERKLWRDAITILADVAVNQGLTLPGGLSRLGQAMQSAAVGPKFEGPGFEGYPGLIKATAAMEGSKLAEGRS